MLLYVSFSGLCHLVRWMLLLSCDAIDFFLVSRVERKSQEPQEGFLMSGRDIWLWNALCVQWEKRFRKPRRFCGRNPFLLAQWGIWDDSQILNNSCSSKQVSKPCSGMNTWTIWFDFRLCAHYTRKKGLKERLILSWEIKSGFCNQSEQLHWSFCDFKLELIPLCCFACLRMASKLNRKSVSSSCEKLPTDGVGLLIITLSSSQ